MSGNKPTNSLIAKEVTTIDGHKLIPTNNLRLDPKFEQSDRYFDAIGGQYLDSEIKLIEFLFEEIRIAREIELEPMVRRSELILSISQGITLKVNIYSEMTSCLSCEDIIDNVPPIA